MEIEGILVNKVEHIGVAVRSIADVLPFYRDVLGLHFDGIEEVPAQKVKTAFLAAGDTHIELLEPTSPDSPVAKFIESRGEGVHHLALEVENLEAALAEAKSRGLRLIDETPRIGARGIKIAFVHPKSTGGVLLEFCRHN